MENSTSAARSARARCVSPAALGLLALRPRPQSLPLTGALLPPAPGKAPQRPSWHSCRITPVVAPSVTHCPLCEHMLVNTHSRDLWVTRLRSEPPWGSPQPPHVLATEGQTWVWAVTQHCQDSHRRRGPSVLPAPFHTGVTVPKRPPRPPATARGGESPPAAGRAER